ncbi:hypothetical protein PV325_009750 [Microctonus aethiopoides]|nr:hypothetical protein PV325_009750 [Microctonus aethiopoides]
MKLWTKKLVILGFTGIFLIIVGIVVGFFGNPVYNFFNNIINNEKTEINEKSKMTLFYIGVCIIIIGVMIFIITMIELFIRRRSQKFEILSDNDGDLNINKQSSIMSDVMLISNGHYWNDRLI